MILEISKKYNLYRIANLSQNLALTNKLNQLKRPGKTPNESYL